jgi:PAS domain S-box-containing protein
MKILLLEDNTTDASLTKRGLMNAIPDCAVEVVSTLREGKALLKKDAGFDIALLDVKLPDGNGLDLLLEIRLSELDMAVIMLTGSGNEELAVAALKAGADDYMVKNNEYIARLPGIIDLALKGHKQNIKQKSEIIDVLYVEHHSSDIDLTHRYFKQYALYLKLHAVTSAEEALNLLAKNVSESFSYKAILLDYRLPSLNALEFIKMIRQELKLDIPIILITGQGNEEVAVQALKLGVNDYLTKNENYLTLLPSKIIIEYQNYQLRKGQTQLVESESKYRLLADNSGDVIFVLNMDLNYTYISPAVKSLRGFDPDEAIKQKINEVLTPESFERTRKLISEILTDNPDELKSTVRRRSIELEMIRKDKSTVWTEVQASMITDENNKPIGILGITRDITQRRLITNELRKLSRAVEQSPVSVIITNTEGIIEYVNPKFSQITGYSSDEIKGKNPRILKSGKTSREEYKVLWNKITSGEEWNGEFYNKRKDGTFYWESATISPIVNNEGRIIHYLAIKEDISDRKKAQLELLQAKEKAEESDRLKTAFLHNISHEIRTPMNAIIGFSALLSEPDNDPETQSSFIETIQGSSNQLLSIINDIVDISSIEANLVKINTSEINLNLALINLQKQFLPFARDKNILFNLKTTLSREEATIKTDSTKVFQILTNLINNALKFTQKGQIVFGYVLKDQMLEFYVSDTGIGIPVDQYEMIFNRFYQVENTVSRQYEGTGLGLSICKGYIELLGGKIWLTSELGNGTTFYFTIPYLQSIHSSLSETHSENPGELILTKPKTILVVEDDDNNYKLITSLLAELNGDIIRAENGEEAVEKCRTRTDIDLVLMDIKMPLMDGYLATKQIRQFLPDLPVIVQTAYFDDREKALKSGCSDFISKPFTKELFLSKILNQLKMHK